MTVSALPPSFWQLLYPWLVHSVVARAVQLSLIFHAIASHTLSTWVSAMLAAGATASTLMTVPVGRLFNRLGPGHINRIATCFCLIGTFGLYCLPLDFEHIYCSILIWIIVGQCLLFTSVASYRGMGALFTGKQRLVAFARMNIVSNISDIVTPVAVGWLFFLNAESIPIVAGLLALTSFCMPRPKLLTSESSSSSPASISLLCNVKKVWVTRPVLLAIFIGATIHAILFVFDLIIPITGTALNLTSTQVGSILSTLALSQAIASLYLSMHPVQSNRLFNQFLNSLFLGSVALFFAFMAQSFISLLVVTLIIGLGFGMIQPLSMSLIYHHTAPTSVGDAVSIRLLLNSLGRIFAPMVLALSLSYMSPSTFLSVIGILILSVVGILKWLYKTQILKGHSP